MRKRLLTATLAGTLLLGFCILRLHSLHATQVVDLPGERLRVVLVGDTSFGENYQAQIEKRGGKNILKAKGYDYSLKNFAPFLRQADLVIANLETSVTDLASSPLAGKKSYLHWSDPSNTPRTLRRHNIRVVSLANNHTLDYGIAGLGHSLEALQKHDIQWFGAGRDEASAVRPLCFDYLLAGKSFRFVMAAGFEYRRYYDEMYDFYAHGDKGGVNAWTTDRATEQMRAVRRANPNALVVAYPHFGENYAWKTEEQTRLAEALIDAGADLVVGHGAHMLQEIEQYKERWIIYGLGNFVFNSRGRYRKRKVDPFSLIARLDIVERRGARVYSLRLYPILSDNLITNYQPSFVSDQQFRSVQELLLKHSTNAEGLRSQMRIGKDEFGRHFVLEVAPGREALDHHPEQGLPADVEDAAAEG